MKKAIAILMMVFISACQAPEKVITLEEPVPYQDLNSTSKGLDIFLEEDTFTGQPDNINIILNNTGDRSYHYGMFYQLEYKMDGLWHIVPYNDDVFARYPDFRNTGRMMGPEDEVQQTYTPDDLGLKLAPGEYRLVKTFIHEDFSYTATVAVPFKIY